MIVIVASIVWLALLIFCVNRATKHAFADGFDVGYLEGTADATGSPTGVAPPEHLVVPRTPTRRLPTLTDEEIMEFLDRERIEVKL